MLGQLGLSSCRRWSPGSAILSAICLGRNTNEGQAQCRRLNVGVTALCLERTLPPGCSCPWWRPAGGGGGGVQPFHKIVDLTQGGGEAELAASAWPNPPPPPPARPAPPSLCPQTTLSDRSFLGAGRGKGCAKASLGLVFEPAQPSQLLPAMVPTNPHPTPPHSQVSLLQTVQIRCQCAWPIFILSAQSRVAPVSDFSNKLGVLIKDATPTPTPIEKLQLVVD